MGGLGGLGCDVWRPPPPNSSSGALSLMCRFGQFSAPAGGCGSLYSAQAKCGSAVLALSRSCVGSGHSLLQLVAAEAFIPHRTNVAVQSWRSVTPVWVWAILCSSWWLRKRFFRTGQMWQCSPDALALLCGFGPVCTPAGGCGSLYPALDKCGSAVLALSRSCISFGHSLFQPLAAETFILHRLNFVLVSVVHSRGVSNFCVV